MDTNSISKDTPSLSIHANLIVIEGMGTLICGESQLGKSELCLMLIDRGHLFISDDAVDLYRQDDYLMGKCPKKICGFMQIDYVGLIDLEKLYSNNPLCNQHQIDLCITLTTVEKTSLADPLKPLTTTAEFLGVTIPHYQFPVIPGKPLALLIETLVKNYKLQKNGYDIYQNFQGLLCNKKK